MSHKIPVFRLFQNPVLPPVKGFFFLERIKLYLDRKLPVIRIVSYCLFVRSRHPVPVLSYPIFQNQVFQVILLRNTGSFPFYPKPNLRASVWFLPCRILSGYFQNVFNNYTENSSICPDFLFIFIKLRIFYILKFSQNSSHSRQSITPGAIPKENFST